jgi:alginate O-acetyltransferase complex protein AlgI
MPTLQTLIMISGFLHLGTLLGSAQVPRELNFREELPKLSPLLRHWIIVAGGYIVLDLIAFGVISLMFSRELSSGQPLARGICAFISVFWGIRLLIQCFLFDAKPYLRTLFLKVGYHGLTAVFLWHTVVYGFAALS